MVGAESLGQLQAVFQAVEDNYAIGAHFFGHGGGVDAQAAGALDHHVVALAGAGADQAGGDRSHGAVDRPQQVVVQLVGDAEKGMAGREV